MTTPCDRLDRLLAASPEAAPALSTLEAGLAAHASTCPRCQLALARSEALTRGFKSLAADFTPAADLAAAARAKAAARAARPALRPDLRPDRPPPRPHRLPALVLAGLVGAALATLTVFALRPSPPTPNPTPTLAHTPTPTPAPAPTPTPAPTALTVTDCVSPPELPCPTAQDGRRLETSIGQSLTVRLSDGTRLTLDQDTVVELPDAPRTLVVSRGEARLEVTRQPGLPALSVRLPTGEVTVLGTELAVRAGASLSVVEVLSGLVSVATDKGTAEVRAGQAAWLMPERAPTIRTATLGPAPRVAAGPTGPTGPTGPEDTIQGGELGFGTLRARRPGAKADADRPLRLVDHEVEVRIQGAFSRTTIEERFASDEPHELEGFYRFTLPPGAQVEELSLLVDGRWERGAFVERDRAERIWAGVIRQATPVVKRREIVEYIWVPGPWKDPAILSWRQGNTFELRIFPIPARGDRSVRIAYTETLPLVAGARRYTLPLPADGSNVRAEHFALDLRVGTAIDRRDLRIRNYRLTELDEPTPRYTARLTDFRPTGDLVVDVPEPESVSELSAVAWANPRDPTGDAFLALTLRPALVELEAPRTPIELVVLVDSSYGIQKTRLRRAADLVAEVLHRLSPEDRVRVLACATTCQPLTPRSTPDPELAGAVRDRLVRLEALGSTRLSSAFAEAAAHFERHGVPAERRRILYVGDGIQSVGELDGPRVAAAARAAIGDTRVTSVALGGETDPVVLGALARAHGGSFIDGAALGSVSAAAELAVRRQHALPLGDLELTLPDGLTAVAPATLGELWPGEERRVFARVTGPERGPRVSGEVVLRGRMGDTPVERRWRLDTALADHAGHAFVPRLWAIARIADLSERDDEAARKEIVALSETHHVLSRHTSLLVLESPAMAKAFGVEATRPFAHWDAESAIDSDEADLLSAFGALAPEAEPAGGAADRTNKVGDGLFGVGSAGLDLDDTGSGSAAPGRTRESGARGAPRDLAQPARPTLPDPRLVEPPAGRRGGEWVPMRKVWYKEARIAGLTGHERPTDVWAERQLQAREAALDQSPDSRERTLAVIRTLVRLGELERAERLTQRWLARDRMDPEALLTLADIAAARGDMLRAEHLVASAIEADPRQPTAHLRLARLYEASDRAGLACEHRLSRALTARNDVAAQVEAIRCGAESQRLLTGLEPALRKKVERQLATAPRAQTVRGPFRLEATWDAPVDLDLIVVDPDGRVISWLGGADLSTESVTGSSRELLTFRSPKNGRWQLFIVRKVAATPPAAVHAGGDPPPTGDTSELNGDSVTGVLRLTAHGVSRRIPFYISGEQTAAPVAEVHVSARFRWERL